MFFSFGDPEQLAQLYYDRIVTTWPEYAVADKPADEMTVEELRKANTLISRCWHDALREGASQDVLDVMERDHEAVFVPLLMHSREFRKFVLTATHRAVGGSNNKEAKAKCQALAKKYMYLE